MIEPSQIWSLTPLLPYALRKVHPLTRAVSSASKHMEGSDESRVYITVGQMGHTPIRIDWITVNMEVAFF